MRGTDETSGSLFSYFDLKERLINAFDCAERAA